MPSMKLIVFALATVGLAYFFYAPLPDGISDPWTLKLIIGVFRIVNLASKWGDAIGYDSGLNISRCLLGGTFVHLARPVSSDDLEITNTYFDDVAVRLYRPTGTSDVKVAENSTNTDLLPVVIYFHGGGFFVFSIDTYDRILRQIAKETQSLVVAVEYRLAPEHPFPTPVNDCYKATVHVLTNAAIYGGDGSRVALAGDSAGGNMAAVVAWKLAYVSDDVDVTLPPVKLQLLLYPLLQAFDFQLPSYVNLNRITHEIVNSEVFAAAWYIYCTGKPTIKIPSILANNHTSPPMKHSKFANYVRVGLNRKTDNALDDADNDYDKDLAKEFAPCITNPLFSPLMADDLTRMPETYILSAEYDILLDECYVYENRLRNAGVRVHHDNRKGGWHGIVSYTRTDGGRRALDSLINYIKDRLH